MKPKIKTYKILMLFGVLLLSTSLKSAHPIKLTASLIEYNSKTNSIRMECRVFIDDFENSINSTLTKNINISNLSTEDKKGIEDYFKKYYTITINNKIYSLKYLESEILAEYNVFCIKFSESDLKIKKGDQICIKNKLFFEEFGFLQSNRITVRMEPFVTENYQTTFDDYSITFNL